MSPFAFALPALVALGARPAAAEDTAETAACPARPTHPARGGWTAAPPPAAGSPALQALESWAFPPRDDATRAGVRTDGLLVVHRGQIIYERYGADWTAERPHLVWSVTKTFVNGLLAVAAREGRFNPDSSVCPALQPANPALCAATGADLLSFSSGLAWRETYEGSAPTVSSVLAMLYGQGRDDMAAFVGQHPLEAPPGSFFRYSSGDSVLLSAIARAALEPRYGPRYASAALFEPLGIRSAVWEADAAGTLVGSSWLHLTPRDMARYGLLWLDQGCWDGARIFPEGWVARSTQVNPAMRKDPREWGSGPVQGWQVWLNQPLPEHGQPQPPLPDAPATAFAALGHWRQAIWVLPEQDLLVIRTGDDRDDTFTHNELLRLALAFAAAHPAPEAP